MGDYRLGPDERFEDIYERRSDGPESLRTYDLVEQVIGQVDPLLERLEDLWPRMPKVEEDGESECPFAEDLYREKQELERQIAERLSTLRSQLKDVSQEVERCKRNLARISVDAEKLSRPEARSKYAESWGRQEQEYVEAIDVKRRVEEVLRRAGATMAASGRKEFPGGLNEDAGPTGLPASASSYPAASGAGTIEQRTDDMLSLGRL